MIPAIGDVVVVGASTHLSQPAELCSRFFALSDSAQRADFEKLLRAGFRQRWADHDEKLIVATLPQPYERGFVLFEVLDSLGERWCCSAHPDSIVAL